MNLNRQGFSGGCDELAKKNVPLYIQGAPAAPVASFYSRSKSDSPGNAEARQIRIARIQHSGTTRHGSNPASMSAGMVLRQLKE